MEMSDTCVSFDIYLVWQLSLQQIFNFENAPYTQLYGISYFLIFVISFHIIFAP